MASNAKYAPAPTHDPDETSSYTQAPPSYQAEASSSSAQDDEARLFGGAPRADGDDDVPDDFKVCFRFL